jgi:peptide/nickel transport system permease protein
VTTTHDALPPQPPLGDEHEAGGPGSRPPSPRLVTWGVPIAVAVVLLVLFVFVSSALGLAGFAVILIAGILYFASWRKLLQLVIVLLLVTFFAASLIRVLPGAPEEVMIPFGSDEQRAELRDELGLNDTIFAQYAHWLSDFVTGDFGSYYQADSAGARGTPVTEVISQALPVSLQLIIYAQLLALIFAIPFGIFAAYKYGTWFDKSSSVIAFLMLAIPNFVVAYLLIYYFAVQRDIFPSQGYVYFGESVGEHFKSMFLPAVSLAIGQIAIYMRLLRSDMVQTLQEDFITMARAKGLSTRRILLKHALRPSSFSLLTVAAINFGALIGGAVIIEVIFQLPGLGLRIFQAINQRQYEALQAFVAVIAIAYVLVNVIVDLLYSVLDPRIRYGRSSN